MLASTLMQIPLLVLSLVSVSAASTDCLLQPREAKNDELALAHFTKTVNEYVAGHQLENGPTVRAGDIFTPEVAAFFRRRIATAVRDAECAVAGALDELEEAALPGLPPPVVDEQLTRGLGEVPWPLILWRLPTLPEELEYRIIGRDLVLLDVHANVVVDILENPAPGREPGSGEGWSSGSRLPPPQAGVCGAHSELPLCWS